VERLNLEKREFKGYGHLYKYRMIHSAMAVYIIQLIKLFTIFLCTCFLQIIQILIYDFIVFFVISISRYEFVIYKYIFMRK